MNLRLLLTSSILGLSLVACNGGGTTPTATGIVGGTVTQSIPTVPTPVTNGAVNTYTLPLSAATLSTLGLSSNPTIALPTSVTPAGATTISNVAPTGISTLSISKGKLKTQANTIEGATALIYAGFTPSSDFTIPAQSAVALGFTFSTTPISGVNYHLAFYNGASWAADTTDTGVVNGNNVTISLTTPAALTLSAGTQYAVALYSIPATIDGGAVTEDDTSGTITVANGSPTTFTGTVLTASVSATVPSGSAATSIPYAFSLSAPAGVTAPTTGVSNVIAYGKFTPSSSVTFASGSTISGTGSFNGLTPSGTYKIAVSSDGSTWIYGLGTSSISDSTLSLTYTSQASLTLASGATYYAAFYQ